MLGLALFGALAIVEAVQLPNSGVASAGAVDRFVDLAKDSGNNVMDKKSERERAVQLMGGELLPDLEDIVKKPSEAFRRMSDQVEALQLRLAESRDQGRLSIEKMKVDYEQQIASKRRRIKDMEEANLNLVGYIRRLDEAIKESQEEADNLVASNAVVAAGLHEAHLSAMKGSQGVRRGVEKSSVALLQATKALSRGSQKRHRRSKKPTAQSTNQPQELLETMGKALGDLSRQQSESVDSLEQMYSHKLLLTEQRVHDLQQEQLSLNATKYAKEEGLKMQQAAVEHLRSASVKLNARYKAIRAFMTEGTTAPAHEDLRSLQKRPSGEREEE